MRTTYFVEPHPDIFSHIVAQKTQDDISGVLIDGLKAAKHVLSTEPSETQPGLDNVNIEFYNGNGDLYGLPFDPPIRAGLFITASPGSDPAEVVKAAQMNGFRFDIKTHEFVETDDYSYWFIPLSDITFETERASSGIRISITPSQTKKEEWYSLQTYHEFVPNNAGEIGLFTIENRPNSLVLNGRVRRGDKHTNLGVMDGDSFGDPMLIRWYPKHQRLRRSEAQASIEEPYGLHPNLRLNLHAVSNDGSIRPKQLPSCRLYAQIDLPTDFFFDKYQLEGDLPSLEPPSELIAVWGDNDLEKPEWLATNPVSGLFQLYLEDDTEEANFTIPLHFRYQLPDDSLILHGETLSPFVFWACKNDEMPRREPETIEAHELLGIESVFPIENTQFFVLPSNPVAYRIPAIGTQPQPAAEKYTVAVVVLGALCVLVSVVVKLVTKESKRKQD